MKLKTKNCGNRDCTLPNPKLPSDFFRHKSNKSGLESYCKICMKTISTEYDAQIEYTAPWIKDWHNAKKRIKHTPSYKGKAFEITKEDLKVAYEAAVKWYKEQNRPFVNPEVDRLDTTIGYTVANTHYLSEVDHCLKTLLEAKIRAITR